MSRRKDIDRELEQENKKNLDPDLNADIIKWFKLLLRQLAFYVDVKTGKDKLIYSYKLNSIRKAYKVIRKYNKTIESGKDLLHLKGIGKGTADRVDEILKTGGLAEVNDADISGAHLEYVEDLMKVFGIGRVKAYELYTVHGIKSIEELRAALKEGKIELPEAVTIGLEYVDQIDTRIPRSEMDEINSFLIYAGIEVDPQMSIRVCGSYRREALFSGDIDVIVSHPEIITKKEAEDSNMMLNFIDHLQKKAFIVASLTSTSTKTKYMGLCKLDSGKPVRRIDIRFMPRESYHAAVLYFTGSGEFNQRMRGVANSLGYTLNEYQLTRLSDSKKIPVNSEKEIFDILSMEYELPANRT